MASWSKLAWKVEPEPLSVPPGTVPPPVVGATPVVVAAPVEAVVGVVVFDELPQPAVMRPATARSPALARTLLRRKRAMCIGCPPEGGRFGRKLLPRSP